MSCCDLIGKRVKIDCQSGSVTGELQKVDCPCITIRKDDNTVVDVTCLGKPIEEAKPVTPDSFWDGVMK